MDGSGSLGSDGFDAVKAFVADLFKKMSFGPTATKGGAVVFSSKDQVTMTSPMTEDGAALIAAVEGATWPFGSTETAAALSMADQMLHTTGRTEVSRDDTFVLLITDGPPNNMKNAIATAEKLHERGQVIVLAVGYGLDPYVMGDIATDSSDVIPVMDALHLHEFVDVVMGHICRQLEFDETYTGIGEDYKGGQTQTRSGHTCQNWRSTTPHSHRYLDVGDHNFCRNPDSDSGGIWCYTTSEDTRWEYCDPKESGSLEYYDR
jgi:integrin beta 3